EALRLLLTEPRRRLLDEAFHQLFVVLGRSFSEEVADPEKRARIALKPGGACMLCQQLEQLIEQAPTRHAILQPRLIRRQHEEHLVDQELSVVRVVRAAEAEQQIDLVDPGEVPSISAAVLLTAHTIGLVVWAYTIEEPLDIEPLHQPGVGSKDLVQGLLRRLEHHIRSRTRDAQMNDARQRIGRALQRKNAARILINEERFV